MAIGEDRPKTMLAIFATLGLAFFGFGFYSYRFRPYVPEDKSFSIAMPGDPHLLSDNVPLPDGTTLQDHAAIVEHPWFGLSKYEYGTFWIDLTQEQCMAPTLNRDDTLLSVLWVVRQLAKAENVPPKQMTFQGRPGWEVRASVVGMMGREVIAKAFWIDCRIYVLMMVRTGSGVDANEAKFFDSFVNKLPPAPPP